MQEQRVGCENGKLRKLSELDLSLRTGLCRLGATKGEEG